MKKRILSLMLTIAMLICMLPFATFTANAETSGLTGNCTWTLNGTALTITGNGAMGDYFASDYPSPWGTNITSVTIENGVTTIGMNAFYNCTRLTSVILPNSVTTIGFRAFYSCTRLTLITIPDSVTYIGNGAFVNCTALTSIDIPNGVTTIEPYTFKNCTNLTLISFPNSVTTIDEAAFEGCTAMTSITIPNSVTILGYAPFKGCTSLTSITIPNSVIYINGEAFSDCTALSSITIPNSVIFIGASSFYNTAYYNNAANWEDGVLYIDNSLIEAKTTLLNDYSIKPGTYCIATAAFQNCTKLTSINIPDSVVAIGYDAFSQCNSLTSIVIPRGVVEIQYATFFGCTSLTSITIPNSVTIIDSFAFANCSNLKKVYYKGTPTEKTGITIKDSNEELLNATWYYIFNDTPATHWAFNSIAYCYENGIMSGTGDGTTFNPSGTMTRAALVSMLYRLEGSPAVSGNAGFSDVAANAWYAKAVTWASQNGIVSGKGDGRFAPTDPVTRMSFVSILYRYADHCGINTSARENLDGFADENSVPGWARANIEWAVAEGLLSGSTQNGAVYVNPTGKATRAQGAVLLQKFCEM